MSTEWSILPSTTALLLFSANTAATLHLCKKIPDRVMLTAKTYIATRMAKAMAGLGRRHIPHQNGAIQLPANAAPVTAMAITASLTR